MSEKELIQEATNRGFLEATIIKPPHLLGGVRVEIPKEAEMCKDSYGNLHFTFNSSSKFKEVDRNNTWEGIIYSENRNKWAEIVTKREEELTPFNLVKDEIYFLENGSTKWYITNKSVSGSITEAGFCIYVGISGYNSTNCYRETRAQFFPMDKVQQKHAYANCKEVKFRKVTEEERTWFNHCKSLNKFVPFDEVMKLKLVVHQELQAFPSEGVCWQPTKELRDYLLAREKSSTTACGYHVKGIAWNYNSCWEVLTYSDKPEYNIKQLEPFISKKMDTFRTDLKAKDLVIGEYYYCEWESYWAIIKNTGATDSERIGGKRISNTGGGGKEFDNGLYVPSRRLRAATPGERDWLDACIKENKFISKDKIYSYLGAVNHDDFILPDKWCIRTLSNTHKDLNNFLENHKNEWKEYRDTWCIERNDNYFHYPPYATCAHSSLSVEPGYTEITFEQFKKHVLTHTNTKQLENNLNLNDYETRKNTGIKVRRTNIEIRQGATIRATGIRCSASKIRLRS